MKKTLFLFTVLLLVKFYGFSQNPAIVPDAVPGAYTDYIYSASDVPPTPITEKYTTTPVPKLTIPLNVNNEKEDIYLDIYTANNPSVCINKKPLVVFCPGNSRDRGEYEFIAKDMARRGYVVASISYRSFTLSSDQQNLVNTAAVHPYLTFTSAMDLHLAIKYLLTRASTYNIDPNYVIVGGGSFGGSVALQATFASKSEIAAKFNTNNTPSTSDIYNPFFNDFDDNVQLNSIKGVIDFYGGIYYPEWIQASENKPMFIYHGNKDPAVPYKTEKLFYGKSLLIFDNITSSGGAIIAQKLKDNNASFSFITGSDVGHTLAPQCGYVGSRFPAGYPMNWYPDMLMFLKNAILCNNLNQTTKTITCTLPDCSSDNSYCRQVWDNSAASTNSANYSIPTIANLPISACQPTTTNEHCHVFAFDGGDYVRIPSTASLNYSVSDPSTRTYTVEFWFKKNSSIPSNSVATLFQGYNAGKSPMPFLFGLAGNNKIWISAFSDWNLSYGNTISIPTIDNNWHHYKIYFSSLISVKIDNTNYSFNNFNVAYPISFQSWYFGGQNPLSETIIGDNNGLNYNIINSIGQMDEVRIWKGINAFNTNTTNSSNICPNQTDLLAYYKFNTDGQYVKDETPNNNTGVKGVGPLADAADPTYVTNCGTSARMATITTSTNPNSVGEKDITVGNNGKEILSLYPNPSSDKPNVAFVAEEEGIGTLEITDMNGNILVQNTNIQYKNGLTLLSSYLPPMASGIYMLKFKTLTHAYNQKFTIIH